MIQKIKNRIGERFLSNEGYWFTITEISDCKKYTVKFDEGFVLYNVTYSNLVRGAVRNPYHPSVFGVGYFGAGKYGSKIEDKKVYDELINMENNLSNDSEYYVSLEYIKKLIDYK